MAFYIFVAVIGLTAVGLVVLDSRTRRRGWDGSSGVLRRQIERAEGNLRTLREYGHAVEARYERQQDRVVIKLNTGVQIELPRDLVGGLVDASPDALEEIEISPAGLALHWPVCGVDLFLPALLTGVFGSKHWLAGRVQPRQEASAAPRG
ncbi:DUF2442 domain-containing protein [Frateuria edaphi]|uniref:DUF2442 domain-containing protein n=1 Tax=Frateuria edaphi TaxID=2898793 RepID=UPI003CE55157